MVLRRMKEEIVKSAVSSFSILKAFVAFTILSAVRNGAQSYKTTLYLDIAIYGENLELKLFFHGL